MSQFGTILSESLAARDALRAANPQRGAVMPDIAVLEAQILALIKTLGDATVLDYDDYLANLRAYITNFQTSSVVDMEMALHAALTPSIVTGAELWAVTAGIPTRGNGQAGWIIGMPMPLALFVFSGPDRDIPVPSCGDSFAFVDVGVAGTVVPATAPANTDVDGIAIYSVTFSIPGNHYLRAVDADVPGWDPTVDGADFPPVKVVGSIIATLPGTATAGVAVDLNMTAYDAVGTVSASVSYALTILSSDAGALLSGSGIPPASALPHDAGARTSVSENLHVVFSAPGTYTVTIQFQSLIWPEYSIPPYPDQVLTVVVS